MVESKRHLRVPFVFQRKAQGKRKEKARRLVDGGLRNFCYGTVRYYA